MESTRAFNNIKDAQDFLDREKVLHISEILYWL